MGKLFKKEKERAIVSVNEGEEIKEKKAPVSFSERMKRIGSAIRNWFVGFAKHRRDSWIEVRHRIKSRSVSEHVIYTIVFVLFLAYAVSLLFPLIWLFMNSFKSSAEFLLNLSLKNGNVFSLPKTWHWENYVEIFSMLETNETNFFGMLFNSLWQAILPILVSTVTGTWFAYILSRFKFLGRNLLYTIIIVTMTVPVVGNTGAYFQLVSSLGVYNTPFFTLVTSIPFGGMAFMVYYGFFKNIPHSYAEAVYIDGGGEFTIFFRIMLPQAKPMIVALAITAFVGSWNDYMTPLLYMPSLPTLASGMYLVKGSLSKVGYPIYYAGLLVTMIPVLVLFLCFSDKMMESMSIGGLKG